MSVSMLGMCLLLFLLYAFVFSGLQEARTQHELIELFQGSKGNTVETRLLLGGNVKPGSPAAFLEIKSLGMNDIVVKGSTATDLTKGPGLMTGTAMPGTKGNAVIAGRAITGGGPFGHLATLRKGQKIVVVTGLGTFTYKVHRVRVVLPGEPDPTAPATKPILTLITSNGGLLPNGFSYVTARLQTPAATAPVPTKPPPDAARQLSGDSAAILPTICWGVVLAACLFLAVSAFRRWPEQLWAVYLMATPVVIAVALVCFENLYRLLPATL